MPKALRGSLIRVPDLPKTQPLGFVLAPDAEACTEMARTLGLSALRKVRLEGTLAPAGRTDWQLDAHLGATVEQPCVVTLAPVTTRIEEPVSRLYLADPPPAPEGEVEMPEDDRVEALPETIDLGAVLLEALALALPAYPRAEGVGFEDTQVAEPGVTPMSDDAAKPFAGLAGLRDSLRKDED